MRDSVPATLLLTTLRDTTHRMPHGLTTTSRCRWTLAKQEETEDKGGASTRTTRPPQPPQPKEIAKTVTNQATSPETVRKNEGLGQQQPKARGGQTKERKKRLSTGLQRTTPREPPQIPPPPASTQLCRLSPRYQPTKETPLRRT